jgi:hypothetical protein
MTTRSDVGSGRDHLNIFGWVVHHQWERLDNNFLGRGCILRHFSSLFFYSCVHKKINMDYRASPGK